MGSPKLPPAARGIPAIVHPTVFKAAHRVAQHHRLRCHRGFPRRDLVSKLGRKTPTKASDLMDIATKFASGQEAVEAIFRKDKQPQGRPKEDAPRHPPSVARKRRPRRRRRQSTTSSTRISLLLPSTGTLGSLPVEPTRSTRCSSRRAPITGVPSSTPLKSATCSGATSTRLDPQQKVAKTKATTRRGATRKRSSRRSTTAS
jgi:hypothetical protein